MENKIFKISSKNDLGYDCFNAAIVSAKNKEEAIKMHPDGQSIWNDKKEEFINKSGQIEKYSWVDNPKLIKVKYIGETKLKSGVILASFQAG